MFLCSAIIFIVLSFIGYQNYQTINTVKNIIEYVSTFKNQTVLKDEFDIEKIYKTA
jgi:hypothetical protein